MRTLVFGLKGLEQEHKQTITTLQYEYSTDFRRMYSNIELSKDKGFISTLNTRSAKFIEYLQKEVVSFYDRNTASKQKVADKIEYYESLDKKLTLKQFKHLHYLKHSFESKQVFGNKQELVKLSKGIGNIDVWRASRLRYMIFHGETARCANRFFDFSDMSNGNITFNLEATDIKIALHIDQHKYGIELMKRLQTMAINKSIKFTVKLSASQRHISYDEAVLSGTKLDMKAFYKTITHIKDKDERRPLIAARHKEYEEFLKIDKLDRLIGIDKNPDGFGYTIMDAIDKTIIERNFIDLSKIVDPNKRRYETSIAIKYIFDKIEHY